jgi:hypothetical protein
MKKVILALLAATLAASPGWAAGLKLTIRDGKVSLDAQEVTIRQILTEWARVGKTHIVNLERVTSGPITVKLDEVPESQALDIILRGVPGYMAAPRASMVADASMYDRILIMATTTAVPARPGSATFPTSPYQPPGNVTQLRSAPPMSPGLLPEMPAGPVGADLSDPAIAAAAAAGLIAVPAPLPGTSDPMLRSLSGPPPRTLPRTQAPGELPSAAPPAGSAPSPVWTAPAGTSQPSLPTPAPTQPSRPLSIAPPQADR